jgi:hypothetical protein
VRLLCREAEHLVLSGSLRWQVGEASNAHAVGRRPSMAASNIELQAPLNAGCSNGRLIGAGVALP